MNHEELVTSLARELALRPNQVGATVRLLDEGNTVPFVARYRKEATGCLDEEQIRAVEAAAARLRALESRRATVLASIEGQGQLTAELRERLLAVDTLTALEDLYRPYKPKRRTRAEIAREKGLQGLADLIVAQPRTRDTPDCLARPFLSEAVPGVADALAGARDIVAETIADSALVRGRTRERALREAVFRCARSAASEDPREVFATYYDHTMRVDRLRPHQFLAMFRGEKAGVLEIGLDVPERDWRSAVREAFPIDPASPLSGELDAAAEDCARRLLLPAIERDVRRELLERAKDHAVRVFARNLAGLLAQRPLAGHTVMGIDPGFRTGCKVAVTDPTGRVLTTSTIHPHEPRAERAAALVQLRALVRRHGVTLVAIGNGTASRETEELVAELLREEPDCRYLIVSEAGASVYSASSMARLELPDLDVTLRGAVSIARRAQDPLAELVKIEPRSIGVGLYQHDVDEPALARALDDVVETVVNRVGVDANTASPALLARVAGIGPKLAAKIVAHRDGHGAFASRESLEAVAGLGPKAFEQCAGFLRIRGGAEPLDSSAIHPESYGVARSLLELAGLEADTAPEEREPALDALLADVSIGELAALLGTGEPTLADIVEQLVRPGRDPRMDVPPPILRRDVLSMADLLPGMRLKGTVRNVVDFGAFVDIGVKQDGLLHRSRMRASPPLAVGDVIDVAIERVEAERGRIALSFLPSDG